MKKRAWSLKEDIILKQAIVKNPQATMKEICSFVAYRINRTPAACMQRYYSKINNPRSESYIHDSIVLEGNKKERFLKKIKKFFSNL